MGIRKWVKIGEIMGSAESCSEDKQGSSDGGVQWEMVLSWLKYGGRAVLCLQQDCDS